MNYLSKIAQNIEPYVPGEQPKDQKYIKLNTNENPYPPSKMAVEAMKNAVDEDLRLYPDPSSTLLVESLANYYNLKEDQVFVGNGSDEILAFIYPTFFSGKKLFYPDITYSFYPVYASFFDVEVVTVPLEEDFSININKYTSLEGNIIIPNPNAPTGKGIGIDTIEEIVKSNVSNVVVIDEAYVDFGLESAISLIDKYPNIIVVQTLSKSRSLAGLRVGMAFGQAHLIDGLNRIKNSFNSYTMDRVAQAGAIAAIKDRNYFETCNEKIIATREYTVNKLKDLGFETIESKANFIFTSHKQVPAEELFAKLREDGILVRYFNKPRISDYLRITIGTQAEMEELVKTLEKILK